MSDLIQVSGECLLSIKGGNTNGRKSGILVRGGHYFSEVRPICSVRVVLICLNLRGKTNRIVIFFSAFRMCIF